MLRKSCYALSMVCLVLAGCSTPTGRDNPEMPPLPRAFTPAEEIAVPASTLERVEFSGKPAMQITWTNLPPGEVTIYVSRGLVKWDQVGMVRQRGGSIQMIDVDSGVNDTGFYRLEVKK